MRVIPFGISSGRPTSTRHVSGLALDTGPTWVLVDCGEGTQQQIMRSPLRPSRLDAVLLTHLHGDHVLGLPGLLGTLAMEGRTDPLPITGPLGLRRWLEVMLDLPILRLGFDLEITELDPDDFDADVDGDGGPEVELGSAAGLGVSARRLVHRVPSFGFRLAEADRPGRVDAELAAGFGIAEGPLLGRLQRGETVDGVRPEQVTGPPRPGRAITVLGDTTLAGGSIELARDADLLVHECTYAAADHDRCERWTHSCSADVAEVVNRSGARRVLLTHFSARYRDPSRLVSEVRERLVDGEVVVMAAVEGRAVPIPPRT